MKMQALLCATLSGPAMADMVTCDLSGTHVAFEIDRTQFAPAIDKDEPERRRLTMVEMGDATFPAEPIMMGDLRGFWAEGLGGSEVMMVMQGNGAAVYTDARAGTRVTGTCEVRQ
jgi:hypothetical protein